MRHEQLHIRIDAKDYAMLKESAQYQDESVARLLRRLIRRYLREVEIDGTRRQIKAHQAESYAQAAAE